MTPSPAFPSTGEGAKISLSYRGEGQGEVRKNVLFLYNAIAQFNNDPIPTFPSTGEGVKIFGLAIFPSPLIGEPTCAGSHLSAVPSAQVDADRGQGEVR